MSINDQKHVYVNMLAGGAQAILTTIVGYPFDLVKSRLQANLYNNSFECVKQTFKNEGLRGLYRGASMPLLSHAIKRPVQYPIAEYMKNEMNKSNNIMYNYGIGALNGLTSPLIGTPLQVVKISMQTSISVTDKNKSSWSYIKHNYKNNGFIGFYRGFIPTAIKDTVFGMSFVGTYYTMRDHFGTDKWYNNFVNGCVAHSMTWFVFMPIDYVKTIIQKSEQKISVKNVIINSYQQYGIRVFWKGVIPACLRTVPVAGCAMTGYELVRKYAI